MPRRAPHPVPACMSDPPAIHARVARHGGVGPFEARARVHPLRPHRTDRSTFRVARHQILRSGPDAPGGLHSSRHPCRGAGSEVGGRPSGGWPVRAGQAAPQPLPLPASRAPVNLHVTVAPADAAAPRSPGCEPVHPAPLPSQARGPAAPRARAPARRLRVPGGSRCVAGLQPCRVTRARSGTPASHAQRFPMRRWLATLPRHGARAPARRPGSAYPAVPDASLACHLAAPRGSRFGALAQ